jgi:hypothetical protein
MARLRLLFALFLVAVGTTFGAFAISGYYEPHMRHGQSMAALVDTPQPAERPQLALWLPKPGLVAGEEKPVAKAPAKPKVAAKAVATKPKPATPALPVVKDRRPQPVAVQWPWNLFGN